MADPAEITSLLRRVSRGDRDAEADLIPQIYNHLKRLARAHLRRERPGHTLQATALVHEAYLKLVTQTGVEWQDRAHFFRVAAIVMRQILVDYARRRSAEKRGGDVGKVSIDDVLIINDDQSMLVLRLDSALRRLHKIDARQADVVEMRFFGGLTEQEIAGVLGISHRTVQREWTIARAWLHGELAP